MVETKTGVFFHPSFSGKEWDIIGNKFRRFPGVMEGALKKEGVRSLKRFLKSFFSKFTPRGSWKI